MLDFCLEFKKYDVNICKAQSSFLLIMADLRSRCGHYIFALWFLILSFFFPRLISAVGDWMSTTWCGLSVNLRCRSETCCMRLAEKYRTQKITKNSPSGHHHTTLSGYIFTTKAHIDYRKKLVKQQYLLHMSSQYGELWPTNS